MVSKRSFNDNKKITTDSMLIIRVYNIFNAIISNVRISKDYMSPTLTYKVKELVITLIKKKWFKFSVFLY